MTLEINHSPAIVPLDRNLTLVNIRELLDKNTNNMQSVLSSKASKAKVFAILQDCPCLVKCVNEIQNANYSNIDSLYSAKHEYAKTKLIDAIEDRFADLVTVSSEHVVPNGRLDIVIKPGSKIVLKYNRKTIAIELKSGKTADASMLFQIERYLPECDLLLFVRIPTEEVTLIQTKSIEDNLAESMSRLNRKISRIINGKLTKVEGDWCRGCNVDCEYKKESKWTRSYSASLENFATFIQNIENVIAKTLYLLEKELK